MSGVKLTHLIVHLNGQQVQVDIDQARQLYSELRQLFEPRTIYVQPWSDENVKDWTYPIKEPFVYPWTDDTISDSVSVGNTTEH